MSKTDDENIVADNLGIITSADQELSDAAYDAQQAIGLAKQSADFLAALAMPSVFEYYWPPVFVGIWQWLISLAHKSRKNTESMDELFARLAIGLPRGFGKTTVIKLFILYVILFTDRQFILILSETATKAQNIIADVVDMLDEPNIRALFGDWRVGIEQDTQPVKKFGYRGRNIIIAGVGAGGSVRGLNLKNARPDVMIFDDVQSREDADSQIVSDGLYRWMIGTAMKAKSPKRCMTVFIANMYPTPHSILKKLKKNPHWTKFIAGGILEDGSSLWEDLQPIAQLLIEYQNDLEAGHPEIFYSEVLNDEHASVNSLVDLNALKEYKYQDEDIPDGKFIVIDPATDKANADAVSVGYFEVYDGHIPALREVTEDRLSPGDTIKESIRMATSWNCPVVFIESNAYQYTLKYWSEFICRQMGIEGIRFIDIYSGKLAKNTRILNMFKEYVKGEIQVHPQCKSPVHAQIAAFRPLKTDNVDGILDLLTYAPRVVQEFGGIIAAYTVQSEQELELEEQNAPSDDELSPF